MQILLILILIVPFWFLIVTPQRRRQREHAALVSGLQVGDRVEGFSGIHGTLTEVNEDTVRIEVADGVVLTMARMAVAAHLAEEGDPVHPSPDHEDADDGPDDDGGAAETDAEADR